MSVMNDMLESEFELKQEIESLRQQLEASQKREVILRLALETCQVGDFSTGHVVYPSFDEKLVEEALAATADLNELILCEKEPFARKISYGSLVFLEGYAELSEGTPLYRAWEPKT